MTAPILAVIRNFSWLAAGQLVFRLAFFALVVVLARTLSTEEYAVATLLLAYVGMWAPVFNFGLGILGVREMAKRSIEPRDFLGLILPLKVGVSIAGWLLMIGVGMWLGYGGDSLALLLAIAAATVVVSLAEFFHLPFTAFEEMHATGMLVMAERGMIAGFAILALVLGLGTSGFGTAYLMGSVVGLGVATIVARRRFGALKLTIDTTKLKWYLREAAPIALTWFFAVAYGRTGVLVLDQLRGESEVALFNTAFFVILSLQMGVTVLNHAMFPRMSLAQETDASTLRFRVSVGIRVAIVGLVLILPVLGLVASAAVPWLFGSGFSDVETTLAVLLWTLPFFSANSLLGLFLQASGMQKAFAGVMGCGLIVSVMLHVPLARAFGALGVAIGTVTAEVTIIVILLAVLKRRTVGVVNRGVLRILGVAVLGVGLVVYGSLQFGTWLPACAAAALFMALVAGSGALGWRDVEAAISPHGAREWKTERLQARQ